MRFGIAAKRAARDRSQASGSAEGRPVAGRSRRPDLAAALGLLGLLVVGPARDALAIPADKLTHFAVSFPCGAAATVLADQFIPDYRLVAGALIGTLPGLAIEIDDSTGEAGFSGGDLLADFIGSTLGALFTDQVVLRFFFDETKSGKAVGVEAAGTF